MTLPNITNEFIADDLTEKAEKKGKSKAEINKALLEYWNSIDHTNVTTPHVPDVVYSAQNATVSVNKTQEHVEPAGKVNETEKLVFTPPPKEEEDAFHKKLHDEIEERKKHENDPISIEELGQGFIPVEIGMEKPAETPQDDLDKILDAMAAADMMGENPPIDMVMEQIEGNPNFEVTTVEDKVLPDGHHIHKETHMQNGVEVVKISSDAPIPLGDIQNEMSRDAADIGIQMDQMKPMFDGNAGLVEDMRMLENAMGANHEQSG